MRTFSDSQRARILAAAADAKRFGAGRSTAARTYDVVDLACETSNYWWQGLTDRQTRIGLRLVCLYLRARA